MGYTKTFTMCEIILQHGRLLILNLQFGLLCWIGILCILNGLFKVLIHVIQTAKHRIEQTGAAGLK